MRREDDSVSRSRFGFHAECKGHTWTTGPSASQRDPLTKSTAWNNGGDIHIPWIAIYIYTYTDRKEPRKLKLIECLWPFHTALYSFLCLRSAFHCIRLAISDKAASQEPLPFDSSRNGEHPMRIRLPASIGCVYMYIFYERLGVPRPPGRRPVTWPPNLAINLAKFRPPFSCGSDIFAWPTRAFDNRN